jgi:ketosteroid isomerase-like protein
MSTTVGGGGRGVVASTREVAEALYRAFLAGDVEGMLALLHDDVEVRFLGQAQLRGKADVARFLEFSAGLLTDVQFSLRHLIVDGPVAAGVWEETARTASGQPWRNHGVDVIHVSDGLIAALHENNDVREVYRHFPKYQTDSRSVR